jgi:exodeoxyribonuclease V gamma subunit
VKTYSCNRLEILAERLAAMLDAHPLSHPLMPETVVVQSRGMARWTSLEIARHSGSCMNFEFPFPRAFVDSILRLFFPGMAPAEDYSAEVMTWKILRLLPQLAPTRPFAHVRRYLDADDGLKAFQLAGRIASLFDQYLVYRPAMLMRWEAGAEKEDWQAILWRALTAGQAPLHLAAVSETLSGASPPEAGALPQRVSLFGVSSLPPLYLRLFFELSRHCEVNFFCLHPSEHYFGHDRTPRQRAGRAGDFPIGNPLLASLGKLNRDFIDLRLEIDERSGHIDQEQPLDFLDPGEDSMLHAMQSDILNARNRGGDAETPRLSPRAGDDSIQIHACHSPTREIEVLYDRLLDLLARIPGLRPRDIVVMMPDIEKYAPYIEAIFGYPENPARRIPFSVADRRPLNVNPVVEAFAALLAIPGSRCTASELFSILDRAPVRRRFAFTDEDLALVRQWIAESGIRWGIDGAHRAAFDLPDIDSNTWQAGLQRLLLGFAMSGGGRRMFDGIMPCDEVEGDAADTLEPLISAVDSLFDLARGNSAPRPVAEWAAALGALLDQFFRAAEPEDAAGLRLVREALLQLRSSAGLEDPVDFRTVRHHVLELLNRSEQRGGFLTGGVTFCALQPMRSIPARVICLIGMDDEAFPRQNRAAAFDRMAQEPRQGDRSTRDDDRYIFLEAIISARERLYCSYIGRSVIDNEPRPPSTLIGELLDYLDQAFALPGGARNALVTEHRLHAFSPQYFSGEDARLFSYSAANAKAARNLRASPAPPAFLTAPLPEPQSTVVELKSLLDFFGNPARHFVRRRLGLLLEEEKDDLDDDEPFEIDRLKAYKIKEELVARALDGAPAGEEELIARGLLPLGDMGAAHFRAMSREAASFRKSVEGELRGEKRGEPLIVDLPVSRYTLAGKIEGIYGERVIQFRCAEMKPKDMLRAWITHLARGAGETVLIATDDKIRFTAVKEHAAFLEQLLQFYRQGLSQPLHFFPFSSLEFADATVNPSQRQTKTPLEKARGVWFGSQFKPGERKREGPWYDFCFGERDPLDAEFERLSLAVYQPLLEHAQS